MLRSRWLHASLGACVMSLLPVGAAPTVEPAYTWDLTPIYRDDAAWEADRQTLPAAAAKVEAYKGRLDESAVALKQALDDLFAVQRQASRLNSYVSMRSDEDTRESKPQGMRQSLQSTLADVEASISWIEPELLAVAPEKLREFRRREPGLAPYARYLERLEKRRPHVLDPAGEKLLGMSSRIRGAGAQVGNLLRDAEIPWPTIRLSDGTELRVDASGYTKGRALPRRDDRVATYQAFYGQLGAFKATLAAALSATVQEHVFESKARHYGSALEAALAVNEVDPQVYRMLVREVGAALPTLHRYLKLRGRMLGIDDLRYHDAYPPLVPAVSEDYSWERSQKLVLEALGVLGEEYVKRFAHALDNRWVDVYPRVGKRSGAYVDDGVHDVHPYMLLNHQDDYSSASTLAHEGGHLMHSWYSQEHQPYPTSGYAIFVAEVASTVDEVLFFKHLVARATTDDERLALLGNFLEGLRTTVFRQTLFAEFELAIHEAAERGEPLDGESLNQRYGELLRRYHGEAAGVMRIDEPYVVEWAFIPHFHYNFYVYQYATSYVAAIALAEGLEQRKPGARERYMAFLSAGSSKPPVELLRDAGVDMASPEPIRAAMRLMNDVVDQIEAVLARRR